MELVFQTFSPTVGRTHACHAREHTHTRRHTHTHTNPQKRTVSNRMWVSCCFCVFYRFITGALSLWYFASLRTSGVAQWLACWAHNPKVRGSKPRSAIVLHGVVHTSSNIRVCRNVCSFVFAFVRRVLSWLSSFGLSLFNVCFAQVS